MAEFKFSMATFEMIQQLAYPLVSSLTGFDPAEFVGEKSVLLTKVGEGFAEISELFLLGGQALADGLLTTEEFEALVAEAQDIPVALEAVKGFFDPPAEPEVPVEPEA